MAAQVSFNELIHGAKPVLVDFYATWCGPCKLMGPVLQEVKHRTGDAIAVIKVDVDKSPEAASAYTVQGVPTLILFLNGKIVWRQSGVIPAEQVLRIIRQYVSIGV